MTNDTTIQATETTRTLPDGWLDLPGASVKIEGGAPVRVCLADPDGDCDERSLRRAIEARLSRWVEIGEWSATSDGETVASARLAEEQPTHKIVFTPVGGEPTVYLVRLDSGDGPAYTHDEWDAAEASDWAAKGGVWSFQGQATPGGENGRVEVTSLQQGVRLKDLTSGDSYTADGATLCVAYGGGSSNTAIEAPASGEGAIDAARERGCYRVALLTVAEWAARYPEEEAYVIDPGSVGQGESPSACIWWAARLA